MRRRILRCSILLVLAAACGGADDSEQPVVPAQTVTQQPPAPEEPPDFTLDLGSGGTFVLSEESRPVFMVFWAEW